MRDFCVKKGCKGDCYRCILVNVVDKEEKPKVIILDDNPFSLACYLEEFDKCNSSEQKEIKK